MKQKTDKKIAWVLAAALCAAAAIPAASVFVHTESSRDPAFKGVYGSTFTAFAEEGAAAQAEYTAQTKGKFSVDNDYLLLVTNIDDVTAYKQVGYTVSVNDGEAENYESNTYYTGITFKTDEEGGTATQTMEEIFAGVELTGMIVEEIEYDPANSYTVTSWLVDNEGVRKEGSAVTVGMRTATISFELPADFTVAGTYDKDVVSGEPLVLPTEDQITNGTGKTLAGWYNVDTQEEATDSTVIAGDMTLAPYFEPEKGLALQPCYGADNAEQPDYVGSYDENNKFTNWEDDAGTEIECEDVFVSPAPIDFTGNRRGVLVQSQPGYSFAVNDAFRFKTASKTPVDGRKITVYTTFTNRGDETLQFHVYQINSQQVITGNTAVDVDSVTIEPGASKSVQVTVSFTNDNPNLMTMIVMEAPAESISMKIDMSMDAGTSTLSYDLPEGVNFVGEPETVYASGENFAAPAVTGAPAGCASLIGWYNTETGARVTENTAVSEDMTVAPYFNVGSDDATQKTPGGHSTGSGYIQGFAGMDSKTTGYCEGVNGRFVSYTGSWAANDRFRMQTGYTVVLGEKYTIYFAITNLGEEDLELYVGRASGTVVWDTASRQTVTVPAGNTVGVTVTYTADKADTNVLPMIGMVNAGSGTLSLHVGMAVLETA